VPAFGFVPVGKMFIGVTMPASRKDKSDIFK